MLHFGAFLCRFLAILRTRDCRSRRPSLSICLRGLVYGSLIILNVYLSRVKERDTLIRINCGYDLFALTRGSFTYSTSDWHRRKDLNLYLAVLGAAVLLLHHTHIVVATSSIQKYFNAQYVAQPLHVLQTSSVRSRTLHSEDSNHLLHARKTVFLWKLRSTARFTNRWSRLQDLNL